jgi:glyoxylase-like metal-dependent hydrolase (beta-lactamase superfamily II)
MSFKASYVVSAFRRTVFSVALALSLTLGAQPDPITVAGDTIGAANLKTVRLSGFGASFVVGQSPAPGEPWPRVQIKTYEAAIDYEHAAMSVDVTREMGALPPRGGGLPFTGEQRQIQAVSGPDAWSVAFAPPAAVEGRGRGSPTAQPQPPQPAPAGAIERMLQIWLTPHGFLKAAVARKAAVKTAGDGHEVSFVLESGHRFAGFINRRNEVEWVRTSIANPVAGDMTVEASYSNYRKSGAASFPMRIIQKQGGHPSLDLWLFSAKANDAVEILAPAAARNAIVAAARVDATPLARDIFSLTGGTHHSVAIGMADHVVVVEAPQDDERSLAVIAKVKELLPGKSIRFVVNTHHHFDHAGGLRAYAAEGATTVTHQINREFYERLWAAPRTLVPDRLSGSKAVPTFDTFADTHVLRDSTRTIEIHHLANSPHAEGLAMVYLPGEKILIEADAYTPDAAPPATPNPAQTPVISPTTLNLYRTITRLNLDVDRIVALHGSRVATMAELANAVLSPP